MFGIVAKELLITIKRGDNEIFNMHICNLNTI